MSATIRDAAVALNERKAAAGLGMAWDGMGGPAREFPSITGAYGLDLEDAQEVAGLIAEQSALYMLRSNANPVGVLAGLWLDGLMAGLELARLRAEGS